jgi:hypothetical protein
MINFIKLIFLKQNIEMKLSKNILVVITLIIANQALAQTPDQISAYVESHKNLAIAEMNRSGIPASITLAQGILETAAGTSPLYLRSNNNFGIKCKSNWNGKFTYHDDDAKGECFRVYDNDSLSYVDHSNFLKSASRYNFLFELDKSDYKSWAIGLRKAGYATNPAYASILIKHIEENNLQQYDVVSSISHTVVNGVAVTKKSNPQSTSYQHSEDKSSYNNTESVSSNLPSAENINKDDATYPTVHWQVSNVSDATNGYTVTPVPGNRQPVYSSKTKSRYTRAKLHNISYGKASTAKKKSVVAKKSNKGTKGTAIASKKSATTKHTTIVAKTTNKAMHKSSSAVSSRKKNNSV